MSKNEPTCEARNNASSQECKQQTPTLKVVYDEENNRTIISLTRNLRVRDNSKPSQKQSCYLTQEGDIRPYFSTPPLGYNPKKIDLFSGKKAPQIDTRNIDELPVTQAINYQAARYPILTDLGEKCLLLRAVSGDEEAKERLLHSNIGIINKIISSKKPRNLDERTNLFLAGHYGLWKAIEHFDFFHYSDGKIGRLSTFAWPIITNEMTDWICDDSHSGIRIPRYAQVIINKAVDRLQALETVTRQDIKAEAVPMIDTRKEVTPETEKEAYRVIWASFTRAFVEYHAIDEPLDPRSSDQRPIEDLLADPYDPYKEVEESEVFNKLRFLLAETIVERPTLTKLHKKILLNHFGLNPEKVHYSAREIAEKLGCSKQITFLVLNRIPSIAVEYAKKLASLGYPVNTEFLEGVEEAV